MGKKEERGRALVAPLIKLGLSLMDRNETMNIHQMPPGPWQSQVESTPQHHVERNENPRMHPKLRRLYHFPQECKL